MVINRFVKPLTYLKRKKSLSLTLGGKIPISVTHLLTRAWLVFGEHRKKFKISVLLLHLLKSTEI